MKHEIVISVNSMEQCRYFYRETLKLGEPLVDSLELCVFKLDDNGALVLEETKAAYLEHASTAVFWSLETSDFDDICADLEKNSLVAGEEYIRLGKRTRKICDPEGNPLLLVDAAK